MNSPRYARIAARLLAAEPHSNTEPAEAKRAQAIELISRALAKKTRRRARRVWASSVAAVAAAGLFGYLGVHQLSKPAPVPHLLAVSAMAKPNGSGTEILNQAGAQALLSTAALPQGGRLVAGSSGGATVQLSTGTQLAVEHDTSLVFESAGPVERFFLSQGVLQAKVAKLAARQGFVVRTPDAEVEVRGTAFRVAIVEPDVNCAAGVRTRVTVSEGIVEVRGAGASTYVHPGESWPAGCIQSEASGSDVAPSKPSDSEPPAVVLKPLAHTPDAASSRSSAGLHPAEPAQQISKEASSIALQNELFAEAAAARRQGDTAKALSSFNLLIARYPSSPLAESAAVQRLNLLQGSEPSAAQAAARDYLARYPRGYAKNDAEKLLAQP